MKNDELNKILKLGNKDLMIVFNENREWIKWSAISTNVWYKDGMEDITLPCYGKFLGLDFEVKSSSSLWNKQHTSLELAIKDGSYKKLYRLNYCNEKSMGRLAQRAIIDYMKYLILNAKEGDAIMNIITEYKRNKKVNNKLTKDLIGV